MKLIVHLIASLFLATSLWGGESVVTGLSADRISLNATFDGSELFVFGAVRRDGPPPEDAGELGVIITVSGPPQNTLVRRKERWFGIWVNRHAVRVRQAPSFYAIAATGKLEEMLPETELLRNRIGLDQAVRNVEAHREIRNTYAFAEALVRLRERNGLYASRDDQIGLAEETLFQTRIELPSNIIEGDYEARFFLVRDEKVIGTGKTIIVVEKTGIERWLYKLAHEQPLAYAALALSLALFAGWLAATIFRMIRN